MGLNKNRYQKFTIEIVFQLFLICLVFVFYAFEHKNGQRVFKFEESSILFFLNYVIAASIINYLLLPAYLYKKKSWHFTSWVLVVIAGVILIEEGVIEQIYFPDTRGSSFPGVFINLTDSLPTITILVGFKFAWDALNKQKEVEQLKMAVKESELQFLKSQINPHFLFNNLNNLYAYALEKSEKTPQIILELSSVLRYMLYECKEMYVPLEKEIDQLENFVNLSQLQFEDRGVVQFNKKNIEANFKIAPLILTVFVENAFKHSASSQTNNIDIVIDVLLNSQGELRFKCSNTFSEDSNTDDLSKGIGLKNVKKRLQLLYPGAHELLIDESDNRYTVELSIYLKKLK